MVDLYDFKFPYNFKKNEEVIWNKKIFKRCPFEVDEVKHIDEFKSDFIGIEGMRNLWNWWELVPINKFNKIIYWIKFYFWYYLRFKDLN